jgi:hypothetical protein
MTSTRTRRALGVGVVLASALVGLFLSALLSGGGKSGPNADGLPGGTAPDGKFSIRAAESNKLDRYTSIVGTARSSSVLVRRAPSNGSKAHRLRARSVGSRRLPLVFLVKRRKPGWLDVYLPARPNLSSGWIRTSDVKLAADRYRLEVQLRRHRLIAWRGAKRIAQQPIAVGKSLSPTPTGRYYVTDLLRPPDPNGFYGPYAFGLSAHSTVFTSFEGGDGQVGIHGTNDPSVIGTDVSHGCIRVTNATITRLAKLLPLGTPVTIRH